MHQMLSMLMVLLLSLPLPQPVAAAASTAPDIALARCSAALVAFQQGDLDGAETELRRLIKRYPLFADARAGLTALLWQRGARGEAQSNWAAAIGLDSNYKDLDWLKQQSGWPPLAVDALGRFLAATST